MNGPSGLQVARARGRHDGLLYVEAHVKNAQRRRPGSSERIVESAIRVLMVASHTTRDGWYDQDARGVRA